MIYELAQIAAVAGVLLGLECAALYVAIDLTENRVSKKRVGGITFIRIGRFHFSFCRARG